MKCLAAFSIFTSIPCLTLNATSASDSTTIMMLKKVLYSLEFSEMIHGLKYSVTERIPRCLYVSKQPGALSCLS